MKCPNDDAVLQMTDRQGIEIDYCPECRGVWLDRGELDKLIERSMSVAPVPSQPSPPVPVDEPYHPPHESRESRGSSYQQPRYDDRRGSGYSKKRKKESFLGDLFDF